MPHRDWKFRIFDMLDAITAIRAYTHEMNFENFIKDRRTVDAVIRNLMIIGEAAARIPEKVCQDNPDIPWYEMRGLRNFVVHEYFGVSDKILWETIINDLEPLLDSLKQIVEKEP